MGLFVRGVYALFVHLGVRTFFIKDLDGLIEVRVRDTEDDRVFVDTLVDDLYVDVRIAENAQDAGWRAALLDHVLADDSNKSEVLVFLDTEDAFVQPTLGLVWRLSLRWSADQRLSLL